jgi:ribonuclease HI
MHGGTKGFGKPRGDTRVSRPSAPVDEVVVWTDGGARGNPGPAGYGVVVTTPSGTVLAQLAEGIGWATNNVAEYRGVIAGLQQALALGGRRVRVRADSLLVVNQQNGLEGEASGPAGAVGRDPPTGRPVRAGDLGACAAGAQPACRRARQPGDGRPGGGRAAGRRPAAHLTHSRHNLQMPYFDFIQVILFLLP